ncbi:MAG: hypothetical protein ACI8QC_000779 [Planctomycetota bacterium]|jgi:hypothetical protein
MKIALQRTVRLGGDQDRPAIYALRHAVYATELGQHPGNQEARLSDTLDEFNQYVVFTVGEELAGFVSITPPGQLSYSVDKYIERSDLPFVCDDGLYEVRILTAAALIARCREQDIFLRDVSSMGAALGAGTFRVAVKDAASNVRVLSVLRDVLGG